MLNFITITGPAYWASYFINGDASGLTDEERAQADRWLEREGVRIVGVATDEETGEMMDPYFTWNYDLHAPESGVPGGDVIDYIAEAI